MKLDFRNDIQIEMAIRLLALNIDPPSKSGNPKPVIAHSLRVAQHLDSLGYVGNVIIIALLHDILEKSSLSQNKIEELFGSHIAYSVASLTIDKSSESSWQESLAGCKAAGRDAMIVRVADLYDNLCRQSHLDNKQKVAKYFKKVDLLKQAWQSDLKFEPIWRRLLLHYSH